MVAKDRWTIASGHDIENDEEELFCKFRCYEWRVYYGDNISVIHIDMILEYNISFKRFFFVYVCYLNSFMYTSISNCFY